MKDCPKCKKYRQLTEVLRELIERYRDALYHTVEKAVELPSDEEDKIGKWIDRSKRRIEILGWDPDDEE